jgi:hypothetical protein
MAVLSRQFLALLCVGTLMLGSRTPNTRQDVGFRALLGQPCPAGVIDERRDLVVRYLPDGKLWLNEESLDEGSLRLRLQQALQPRFEKLVWIAADERVSYGDVVSVISKLNQDTPDLHIALATKAQVGPVDPTDMYFRDTQLDPRRGISSLCVY